MDFIVVGWLDIETFGHEDVWTLRRLDIKTFGHAQIQRTLGSFYLQIRACCGKRAVYVFDWGGLMYYSL